MHPPCLHEEQLFDVTQQWQHRQGRGWDVSIDDSNQIRLVNEILRYVSKFKNAEK